MPSFAPFGAPIKARPGAKPGGIINTFKTFNGARNFTVSDVSHDAAGVALGGCTIDLFDQSNTWLASTVSDGSGNWSFTLSYNSGTFYVREYLVGSPDVAGTSSNGLTAV